jgi:hypothetical protein
MLSCCFFQKLDEKPHFVHNMTKIKNCGVKTFRKMTSIKILLLCCLSQILERNEQAFWGSKVNQFMVISISWIKSKGLPQQAEVAQGVPGRLRPLIFLTFRRYKGCRSSAKRIGRL